MATIDEDLMLSQISWIERENFSDPWSLESLWSSMTRDYNLIYFALGNEEKYTIYSFRGGQGIEVNCIKTIYITPSPIESKPGEKILIGYIIATDIAGESELLRIAIADKYKRHGIGSNLVDTYIDSLKHCDKFYLEVRESNEKARQLYEKYEYKAIGIRKDYYTEPAEDAVIYHYTREESQDNYN